MCALALMLIAGCGSGGSIDQEAYGSGGSTPGFAISGKVTEVDGVTPVAGATCTLARQARYDGAISPLEPEF